MRTTIAELENLMGQEVESYYVLKSQKAGLTEKAEWINAVFEDQSGKVDAVIWKEAIPPNIKQLEGHIVKVVGKVGLRNGETQLRVKEISLAPEGEGDLSEFAPALSAELVSVLKAELFEIIASVKDKLLRCLLQTVFSETVVAALAQLPGGHTHHVYNGGLLVHIIEVAKITAQNIALDEEDAKYHMQHLPVNRDLAIAGALLHDIGKGKEFLPFPFNKRRENSYFVGFPSAGVTMIDRYIDAIERANDGVKYGAIRDVLENIACSCHVTYRDCVPPRTKEAILVRLADRVSADRDAFDTELGEYISEHPGEKPGMIYSEYFHSYITMESSQQTEGGD